MYRYGGYLYNYDGTLIVEDPDYNLEEEEEEAYEDEDEE